jgi:hypothetical protein
VAIFRVGPCHLTNLVVVRQPALPEEDPWGSRRQAVTRDLQIDVRPQNGKSVHERRRPSVSQAKDLGSEHPWTMRSL